MFKGIRPILYAGREVLPLIEGGKGVSATNHLSSGAWAAAGGIGTVSAVNADSYDPKGGSSPRSTMRLTRRERHEELIRYAVDGAVQQVHRAWRSPAAGARSTSTCCGRWAAPSASSRRARADPRAGLGRNLRRRHALQAVGDRRLLRRQLSADHQLGARLRALWKRAYHKAAEWLGAVVYEDPWLAGGHNGLHNAEDPLRPEDPYPRVKALRETMREGGIPDSLPIVMAGGVWNLKEWEHWIDNPGARPDRLPVRHPAPAHQGKPDPRGIGSSGC